MKNIKKVNADDIKEALRVKHANDVFLTECKNGPTWFADGLVILDAWAMKKSWKSPKTTGYEIKIDRSDYMNDGKWQKYLPYCNEFYFVASGKDLIRPNELAVEAGLMYLSSTGKKIITLKKSIYRDVEIPQSLYEYILMHRVRIVSEQYSEFTEQEQLIRIKRFCRKIGFDYKNDRPTVIEVENKIKRIMIENDLIESIKKLRKKLIDTSDEIMRFTRNSKY